MRCNCSQPYHLIQCLYVFTQTSVLIQAKINTGEYWQYDNSTQLGYRSVFKICIDDGNEVTYSIAVGDGSVHSGVQVYEDNPSGKMKVFFSSVNDIL